jgi:hypothetical protein
MENRHPPQVRIRLYHRINYTMVIAACRRQNPDDPGISDTIDSVCRTTMVPQDPLMVFGHGSSPAGQSAGIGSQQNVNSVINDQALGQSAATFAIACVVITDQAQG